MCRDGPDTKPQPVITPKITSAFLTKGIQTFVGQYWTKKWRLGSESNRRTRSSVATKATMHTLTTSLASELAADNIRINTVAPGIIRTPIYGDADVDSFGGIALMNRVGEVEEITDAIIYLATAGFTTGATLTVDGGYVPGRA